MILFHFIQIIKFYLEGLKVHLFSLPPPEGLIEIFLILRLKEKCMLHPRDFKYNRIILLIRLYLDTMV